MKRLPVYILADTSSSMAGDPIEAVTCFVQMLVILLKRDPQALEIVQLSVLTCDASARVEAPLTDLLSFIPPQLRTCDVPCMMGEGLNLVAHRIGVECRSGRVFASKSSNTFVDDDKEMVSGGSFWNPILFVLTAGVLADRANLAFAVARLKRFKFQAIIACAAGAEANEAVLREVAEHVVKLSTSDSNSIGAFFKWVS